MWFCIDSNDDVAVGSTALEAWAEYQRKFDSCSMSEVFLFNVTNVTPNKLSYAVTPVETKG